jgi:hypothetical protein
MLCSSTLILIGFIGLLLSIYPAVALIAYGAGNGLWSIARGVLPLSLFDTDTYAVVMGKLARPMLFAGAIGPLLGSFLIGRIGAGMTLGVLTVSAGIALLATTVLFVSVRTNRKIN